MTNEKEQKPEGEVPNTDIALQAASPGGTDVAVQDDVIDFEGDAGSGAENITASMLVIPFLSIIQATSGYVKKSETSQYIKGAEEGFIINTASKQMWNGDASDEANGVNLIVCNIRPKHVEWVPKEKGGGLVKIWEDDSYKRMSGYVKAEKGQKIITPAGNEIIEYLDLFSILQDRKTGDFTRALFSAKSTSIKPTRQLLTQLTSLKLPAKKPGTFFQPAMFFSAVRMTTASQQNTQGSWFTPKFDLIGRTVDLVNGPAIYADARKFYDDLRADKVKVDDVNRERNTGDAGDGELPF